ncbi:MAG TPA: prepilin-type N-terminal cleavage/methylation domain-containing protein [bacterium]|nr:prepilin-type N-terminal cleavage/methylation domain-containing protein [bacterium]
MFFLSLKFKNNRALKGFTLMEILVAMSIFVMVALVSLSIHSFILRASQKTIAYNRAQQDVQMIMESLAKKIRTSRVDYAAYAGGVINSGGENNLHLIDLADNTHSFFVENQELKVQYGSAPAQTIPSDLIKIINLKFYIQPLSYPFDINEPPVTQPRVTIVMQVEATKGGQKAGFTIQQTVPQRSGGLTP